MICIGHRRAALCIAAAAVIAAVPCAAGEVYRCTENGKTVYSDQPCPGGGKAIDIHTAPVSPAAAAAVKLQSEAAMGRLAIGQTARQVESAWGTPKSKNIDTRASGIDEQWVYERKEGTTYVYIRNGMLSSVSQHQEVGGSVPVQQLTQQPTRAELSAQERVNKANERRFIRQGNTQEDVAARLGTPDSTSYQSGGECWTYLPTPQDPQTRTTVCFGSGRVRDVQRAMQR